MKKSGTQDWLEDAMRAQEEKNRQLSGMWGDTPDELERRNRELAGMLDPSNLPPEPEPEKAPDLFADERESQARARRGLASVFEEEQRAKEAERQQLQSMFGPPKGSPPKKKR
ncbi:MAG: hypothetical protein AB1758_17480 [Candidatus Eremiobacterota bacterium]